MCVHAYLRLYNGCLLSKQNVCGMLTACQQILRQISVASISVFHNSPAKIDTDEKNKPPKMFPHTIKISNMYLKIRGDGHEDLFSVGCDSIEQS
ncbi:hypothetical protein ALC53_07009 [Atta colombica]|uniref:Uncharacterized protein n=1 Tax=Atta colombica TaxID=520822 RepID=A0A195BD83_9HYME|nr:hypothetical protein ALC53_07009 [Atta colombica]